jgi:hypothetical protein
MISETERSYLRLAAAASAHSQRFGLSGYTLGPLSNEQVFNIGCDLVRLFEQRYEEEIEKTPPNKSETPSGFAGSARARKRLRDQ